MQEKKINKKYIGFLIPLIIFCVSFFKIFSAILILYLLGQNVTTLPNYINIIVGIGSIFWIIKDYHYLIK